MEKFYNIANEITSAIADVAGALKDLENGNDISRILFTLSAHDLLSNAAKECLNAIEFEINRERNRFSYSGYNKYFKIKKIVDKLSLNLVYAVTKTPGKTIEFIEAFKDLMELCKSYLDIEDEAHSDLVLYMEENLHKLENL